MCGGQSSERTDTGLPGAHTRRPCSPERPGPRVRKPLRERGRSRCRLLKDTCVLGAHRFPRGPRALCHGPGPPGSCLLPRAVLSAGPWQAAGTLLVTLRCPGLALVPERRLWAPTPPAVRHGPPSPVPWVPSAFRNWGLCPWTCRWGRLHPASSGTQHTRLPRFLLGASAVPTNRLTHTHTLTVSLSHTHTHRHLHSIYVSYTHGERV